MIKQISYIYLTLQTNLLANQKEDFKFLTNFDSHAAWLILIVIDQDVYTEVQSEGTKIQEAEASGSSNRIKYIAYQLNYRKTAVMESLKQSSYTKWSDSGL